MGEHYEHLSLEERCQIAQLRADGRSIRQIAAAVDRPPSTISRELTRNSGAQLGYKPAYAQAQARARPLGSRSDALRHLRPGDPRRPRAQIPLPLACQAAQQSRSADRPTTSRLARAPARRAAPTITFDNGTEFALHHQLNTQLGM